VCNQGANLKSSLIALFLWAAQRYVLVNGYVLPFCGTRMPADLTWY
jgi:hypothetical protein